MNEMFFENKSEYAFDETVEKLTEIIGKNGWSIPHTHDLQATMKKNGYEVSSVKVMELCKPDYAFRLLSDDSLRIYSNMMPCRISVYMKDDGKTYVSRMNSAAMAAQIGGAVQETMSNAFRDVEQFIEKVAE